MRHTTFRFALAPTSEQARILPDTVGRRVSRSIRAFGWSLMR